MIRLFIGIHFLLFFHFTHSQYEKIDSLLNVLKSAKHDTTRYNIYMFLGIRLQNSNPDSAIYYHFLAEKIAQKIGGPLAEIKKAEAIRNKAWCYFIKGNYNEALRFYDQAMIIIKKHIQSTNKKIQILSRVTMSSILGNIATVYINQSNHNRALDYYFSSLKIDEEIGNKTGQAANFGNIGIIYYSQKDYNRALEYFLNSLRIAEEINEKNMQIANLGNIGLVYYDKKEYPKVLQYYNKALEISKSIDDKIGISTNLANIGNVYLELGDVNLTNKQYDTAYYYYNMGLKFYDMAQKIDIEIGNRQGEAINLMSIGMVKMKQKKYIEAEKLLKTSEKICREIQSNYYLKDVCFELSKLYELTGRYKEALQYFKEHINIRDSILSDENRKAGIVKDMNYKYEKEQALKEQEHQKQLAIEKEKQEKQKVTTRFIITGLVLVLLFSGFIVNRLQVTRRQKRIIENQKQIVEEQKKVVEEQKLVVEQKNKDITDSIKYAKRIQEAILPHPQKWKQFLPDSFILYLPKDIVAGDFYWMEVLDDYVYVAAADCTGHGVPGAMVSVVCSNALTKAVLEEKILNTDEILNRVREIVIEKLTSEENIRDGMDVCLIRLTKNSDVLQYSGANRPLYVVSPVAQYVTENSVQAATEATGIQLIELKPDKQPIGRYEEMRSFSKQEIVLQKNCMLYLTTDGFADQFGGEKGKKIGTKAFKKLLKENASIKHGDQQREHLFSYFQQWKTDEEQMDDVTVLGIKIT